jgi:HPt (histidine-containing phosphotransfer) domain-containing protein
VRLFDLGTRERASAPPKVRTALPVLDDERFLAISAGDAELGRELSEKLVENLEARARELWSNRRDLSRVAKVSHALRGIALNFGATRLAASSHALELVARAGCAFDEDVAVVVEEVERVRAVVAERQDAHP